MNRRNPKSPGRRRFSTRRKVARADESSMGRRVGRNRRRVHDRLLHDTQYIESRAAEEVKQRIEARRAMSDEEFEEYAKRL